MLNYVILCGGTGSRLWPLSREKLPKQLLPIVNEKTMLQNTVLRSISLPIDKITVICNVDHAFIVKQQLEEVLSDTTNNIPIIIITEPIGRDTAAAVVIAALQGDTKDTTLIVPCDHVFDSSAFTEVVLKGLTFVDTSIVTFGITPTHPETGYGYIETNLDTMQTLNFVEKPKYNLACEYFSSGNYLWNAGVFLFKNQNMLSCFQKYADDILRHCTYSLSMAKDLQTTDKQIVSLPNKFFGECRAISVDYAIMEKLCSDNATGIDKITIPYTSTWCDIGSFHSLHEHLLINENIKSNEKKNVFKGDIMAYNTTNCYIDTENALVAVVGLDNIIVVNTRDSLLVCNKNCSQDVKKIVDALKSEQREERIIHAKAFRPWGWYCNIEGNNHSGFKVKRICVYPNKKMSLQSHDNRSEHWVIVKGLASVQVGHDFLKLGVNQHVYIPKKTLHRIENIGDDMLEFVETQIGDYLGEDDIIRYQDDFGRT